MPNADDPSRKVTLNRRALLLAGTGLGLDSALSACQSGAAPRNSGAAPGNSGAAPGVSPERALSPSSAATPGATKAHAPSESPILATLPLGAPPWKTFDPFLFCVHHKDDYPAGNPELGPRATLEGRNIGRDFAGKDGWSMYHGDIVPGFPRHPHRGFETVTITRRGHVDHSDSLGATARYGEGDVQWMTAGSGIVHAEMFPLLNGDADNPTELFQIWLNLPAQSKFAKPHFSMFWDRTVPRRESVDAAGRTTRLTLIAGDLAGNVAGGNVPHNSAGNTAIEAPPAPPDSWAARAEAHVAIGSIRMQAGARWDLPAAPAGVDRTLYFFAGSEIEIAGATVRPPTALRLRHAVPVPLLARGADAELLLLQGRPIGEPVVQHGPFVMNRRAEIEQAVRDYQRTQFGGWPWPRSGPVHAPDSGRFARHADGRIERA